MAGTSHAGPGPGRSPVTPLLRVVPPAPWVLTLDRKTEHIAFFSDDLEQLALATSALGLGLTLEEETGRVSASRQDLKRLAQELKQRRSPLVDPLERYLSPIEQWKAGSRELKLDSPLVMGIVNLTEDSFSGDGVGTDVTAALSHAERLRSEGADIIDVGAETARASRPQLEAHLEATIASPVVAALAREGHLVSIDTYKREVAEAAVQAGATIVNDISGLTLGTEAAKAAAEGGAGYVLNYSYSVPKHRPDPAPNYADVVMTTISWMADRLKELERVGLPRNAIAIDPGIAFGKSHDEDLQALRRLCELGTAGQPLLLAHSRKNYIGTVSGAGPEDRDLETHISTALAYVQGARIFRVHDVAGTRRTLAMAAAIATATAGNFSPDENSWPWAAGVTASDAIAEKAVIEPPQGQRW